MKANRFEQSTGFIVEANGGQASFHWFRIAR